MIQNICNASIIFAHLKTTQINEIFSATDKQTVIDFKTFAQQIDFVLDSRVKYFLIESQLAFSYLYKYQKKHRSGSPLGQVKLQQ